MAKPPVKTITEIAALPPVRREQLDALLLKGISPSQIAIVIQNEWKIWLKEKPGTIKKRLERYRAGPLKTKLIEQTVGATQGMKVAGLAKRLNALDELEELVGVQKARFIKAYTMEANAPLLLKQATDEGRLLKEMLVELGRLQLETGILHRVPKKITGKLTDGNGSETIFEWTQEQEALFEQIDQLGAGYVKITQ